MFIANTRYAPVRVRTQYMPGNLNYCKRFSLTTVVRYLQYLGHNARTVHPLSRTIHSNFTYYLQNLLKCLKICCNTTTVVLLHLHVKIHATVIAPTRSLPFRYNSILLSHLPPLSYYSPTHLSQTRSTIISHTDSPELWPQVAIKRTNEQLFLLKRSPRLSENKWWHPMLQ